MSFTLSKLGAEITVPDLKIASAEVRSYPVADSRFDSTVEQEITFARLPKRMEYAIPLTVKDAVFIRQPPLTEELNPEQYDKVTETEAWKDGKVVVHRPVEYVDSLAVYHSYKIGNEAKAGKIMHIPRPKCVDKLGAVGWGKISYVDGNLIILLPEEYMKNAEYPVVVDPTFGYTSIGGTSHNGVGGMTWSYLATLSENGNVSKLTWYVANLFGEDAQGGVYGGGAAKIEVTNTNTFAGAGPAWLDLTFAEAEGLTAGGCYLSGWMVQGDVYYDAGDGNTNWVDTGQFPDTIDGDIAQFDRKMSIYATYETGGGGLSMPVAMHHYNRISHVIRG